MANEIIDTIKAAIISSESNTDDLLVSLKEILGEVDFKTFIVARRQIDILRYEKILKLDDTINVILDVKDNNDTYIFSNTYIFNKQIYNNYSIQEIYLSQNESSNLNPYKGPSIKYHLDRNINANENEKLLYNPNIVLETIKI